LVKRGISISVKLIVGSTTLVIFVIGLFGVINSMSSRRIIDDATNRLREKITAGLRQAGMAQLQLFAEATRLALLQSDYSTLQTMSQNIVKEDERVTEVVVVDAKETILAHNDAARAGTAITGPIAPLVKQKQKDVLTVQSQKAMTFVSTVRQEGAVLCSVALVYSLKALDAELAKAESLKSTEVAESLKNTLLVGVFSVLLGMLLAVFEGLRLSKPIQAVVRQVNQIASGDLQARVEIKSGDEIGLLGDRFNFMAEQVLLLMRETMKKATMEKELELASAIQSTLVPDSALVQLNGISVAGYFKPATQCGGDWWNYYTMPDGRLLILIGDVTGHGVASAMITAAAKGAATTMMAMSGGQVDLRSLLVALNAAIHDTARGRFVMTCFATIFDPVKHTLQFANAGHNFPYLYEAKSGELVSLVLRGNRLGDIVGTDFEIKEIPVTSKDTMIWYTDGIVECEDIRGEEFGERRFRALLRKNGSMMADELRDEVIAKAQQFYGAVPQKDDITLIVGKFS
jgi:serine phosphatase RsbU (regulator of sigma subunit)